MANPGVDINYVTGPPTALPAGQAVVAVIGTAPGATIDEGVMVLVESTADLTRFGSTGGLPVSIAAVEAQGRILVVAVRLPDVPTDATLAAAIEKVEAAPSLLGVKPTYLAAPGWTYRAASDPAQITDGNAVVTKLEEAAEELTAIAYVDAPTTSTTDLTAAIADARSWAGNNRGSRLMGVFPRYHVANVTGPIGISAYWAGARAAGNYWDNPMGTRIRGLVRPEIGVPFNPAHRSDAAGLLQSDNISVVVNEDGTKMWGATLMVAENSTDPLRFLNSKMAVDDFERYVIASSFAAQELNVNPGFSEYVITHTEQYIEGRKAKHALRDGSIALNGPANNQAELSAGRVHFLATILPPIPAQAIIWDIVTSGPVAI